MARVPVVAVLLFLLLVLAFSTLRSIITDIRNGFLKKGLIKIGIIVSAVFLIKLWGGINNKFDLPIPMGNNVKKEYIMTLNEKKSSDSGTKVSIGKALLDLKYISFNVGIKGKDKLVAVEIKKNLEEDKNLNAFQGLWAGGRFNYEYNGFALPYSDDEFISTVYVICHLSNGEALSFKLEDLNNVKEKTKLVKLNESIEHEGKTLTITGVSKALNYTSVSAKSSGRFWDMEVYLMVDGKEVGKSQGSWAGGGGIFDYSFSFKPIEGEDITLKFKMKNSNKEYLVKVKN